MLFQSEKMRLEPVRVVLQNRINDVYICKDLGTAMGSLYTLLVIKDHSTVRKFLEMYEQAGPPAGDSFIESFSGGGAFCVVFEYKQERPLKQFYMGEAYSLEQCEEICRNLLIACMSSGLPYPLLYLALTQDQLHLSRDNTVYLGYQFDLTGLRCARNEKDCVVRCASILCKLLQAKASANAFSYKLLEKKTLRKSYEHFGELYKDISKSSVSGKKRSLWKRIKVWVQDRHELLFSILLVVCGLMALYVVLSFVTQLIFGDVPWLRLLFNSFKIIGTENLLQ